MMMKSLLVVLSCSWMSCTLFRPSEDVVFLSDMQELEVVNIHRGLGKDATYWGAPLSVAGVTYRKALVTHPGYSAGYVEYDLGGGFSRFRAIAAILDDAKESSDFDGTVVFEVEIDGRSAYRSPVLNSDGVSYQEVDVDVSGARKLRLWVNNVDGRIYSDHAAWVNARVIR